MNKEWPCSHITKNSVGNWWYTDETEKKFFANYWEYCPKCGATRPKKKELWMKFVYALGELKVDSNMDIATKLELIAEEHFKGE